MMSSATRRRLTLIAAVTAICGLMGSYAVSIISGGS